MSWDVVSCNFEHGYQHFNNGTYLPNYMLQYPKRPQTQHSLLGELQNILLKVKSIRQNFLEIGLAIKPQLPTGFFFFQYVTLGSKSILVHITAVLLSTGGYSPVLQETSQ